MKKTGSMNIAVLNSRTSFGVVDYLHKLIYTHVRPPIAIYITDFLQLDKDHSSARRFRQHSGKALRKHKYKPRKVKLGVTSLYQEEPLRVRLYKN